MSGNSRKSKGIPLEFALEFLKATDYLSDNSEEEEEDDQQSVGSSAKENHTVTPIKFKTKNVYKIDPKVSSKKKRDSNPTVSPILIKRITITEVAKTPVVLPKPFVGDDTELAKDHRSPLKSITRTKNDLQSDSSTKEADPPPRTKSARKLLESPQQPFTSLGIPTSCRKTLDVSDPRLNSPTKEVRVSPRKRPVRNLEASKSLESEADSPLRKLSLADKESSAPHSDEETPRKRTRRLRRTTAPILISDDEDNDLAVPLSDSEKSETWSPSRSTRPRRASKRPDRYTPERAFAEETSARRSSLRRKVLETPRRRTIDVEMSSPVRSAKKKLQLTPDTPRSAKKVGRGFLSPIVPGRTRRGTAPTPSSLDLIRTQLHASSLPKSLPCREKEFNNIKSFIERKINDGAGGCMYISGVPGTGKTASVHSVIRVLQQQAENDDISFFDFVEINGLRLTQPKEAYVRIWQTLTNQKLSAAEALNCLEKKFLKSNKRSTVLLVDELDYLCNRRQDVIYNILDWSTQRHSKLVVLTIANTMDLPERTLKGKVTSRMGLTRLVFQPYSFKQLETIVLDRLAGSSTFQADAVQLVVRKVAAVSGDARRALDLCRRATDVAEGCGRETVTVADVETTLSQIFKGSRVTAVKHCSRMAQFVLRALRDEILRTGVEESTVRAVYPQIVAICAFEGVKEPTSKEVSIICSQLSDSGLIVAERGRKDLSRKLSLNISCDDVHFALNV